MEWWQTFFDDQYLKLYDTALPAERTERELKGVLGALQLAPGAEILDLCCGQGRHAVGLARAGFRVTGLDLSPHLLAVARKEAEAAGVEVAFIERDMRDIPFESRFDAIVNLFTAFGYFEEEAENQRVLAGVARALRPGGKFLVDVPNIFRVNNLPTGHVWYETTVGPQLEDHRYDPLSGRTNNTFRWLENGQWQSRSFSVRSYAPNELVAMLKAVGLATLKLYGGFDLSDFDTRESRRLIVLSEKR